MEFKRYNKNINVNGIDVTAEIVVTLNEDDATLLLDQDFENETQRKAYIDKIEREEVFAGYITVTATFEGLEGFDSLGACELVPNNMFNSKPFNDSVESYLTEYGMEATAIAGLRSELETEYSRLTLQADKFRVFAK